MQNNNCNTREAIRVDLWKSELDEAIRNNDDDRIWEIVASQKDQIDAHNVLATLVPRLAYKIDGKNRYSEFLTIPIIETPGSNVIGNSQLWSAAVYTICDALDVWVSGEIYKTVFNEIRAYDWFGTWRPEVTRGHLTRIMPGSSSNKMTMVTNEIRLPGNAPRLGFICFVATSERGWPRLPDANSARDQRFKDVVSFSLVDDAIEKAPVVLAPDCIQFAVPDGICLWLMELHKAIEIQSWSVAPIMTTPDVVTVTLRLNNDEVPITQFTVLKHQTGLQGLDDVMKTLQFLAPMEDTPVDVTNEKNKEQVDLT